MTTPHKHAALIKKWADDPSQPVWAWSAIRQSWVRLSGPPAWTDEYMAVGPRPAEPPKKMCILAGVEFPMPASTPPSNKSGFCWLAVPHNAPGSLYWTGSPYDIRLLDYGLVHHTEEAAAQHSRALVEANKQAMKAAQ